MKVSDAAAKCQNFLVKRIVKCQLMRAEMSYSAETLVYRRRVDTMQTVSRNRCEREREREGEVVRRRKMGERERGG